MVKIRKPKKENNEVFPIENTDAINETLSKSEEFINNNSTKLSNNVHALPTELDKEIALLKIAKKFFDVSIIIDSNKDMSEFNMLHNLNDIDRT